MICLQRFISRSLSSDINSLANAVLKKNPIIKSSQTIIHGIKRLKEMEPNSDMWINSVVLSPSIIDFKTQELQDVLSTFELFDISRKSTWNILGSQPEIIEIPDSTLRKKLNQVEGFSRSIKMDFDTLITTYPMILFLESDDIGNRVGLLSEYFTKPQISELFLNSPLIMFDEWHVIESRINYLFDVMYVHVNDILEAPGVFMIESHALSQRYEFLKRAGLYRQPDPKGIDEGLHAFPPLKKIIDGSDEEFVAKVVGNGISVEEYDTFKQILNGEEDKHFAHFDSVGFEDLDYVEDQLEDKKFLENTKKIRRKK
ncbi:transcription termination factor 4, mitochondrial [Lepeophtheirus salmonis]|uniref:transcription termination factor 4, mitochondrial n=1 Tax=Lepeophtheirus salmonis TaxID=72036 RepID=UPI003AF3E890